MKGCSLSVEREVSLLGQPALQFIRIYYGCVVYVLINFEKLE